MDESVVDTFRNKHVIVSGGTSEIAVELVKQLVDQESKVCILIRNEKKAMKLYGRLLNRE